MTRGLCVLVLTACLGCEAAGPNDAASDGGAAEVDADAGSDGATSELAALVRDAVADWDGIVQAKCQCLISSGAFATIDECVAPSASGPTWQSCGTMVLAANDSPETRAIARCLGDELRTRRDCLSSTACDSLEHEQCDDGAGATLCASNNPQVFAAVLQACPDLGLLSRL